MERKRDDMMIYTVGEEGRAGKRRGERKKSWGSETHRRLTRMARPSVSKEIMCRPDGDTAVHCISVKFSHGSVVLDDSCKSTSVTRLPTDVNRWLPFTHRLPPL